MEILIGSTSWSRMVDEKSRQMPRDLVRRTDEATQRYRFLFENARDIILFVSSDGRIIEANKAALAAYGYSLEELLSLHVYDLRASPMLPAVDFEELKAALQSVLFDTVHRRKDGSLFPVEVSTRAAVMDGQQVLLSIIRDVSDRKHTEQVLAEKDRRYRVLFDQLVEAFAVCEVIPDEDGQPWDYRVLDVNPAFQRMTGVSGDEVVGKTVREVLPHLGGSLIDTFNRVMQEGEALRFASYSAELGRYYEVVAFRPTDGQVAALFWDVTDITELDRLKDQFIAVAAHELKTPVAVMKGYAQLLLNSAKGLTSAQRRHLYAIDRGSVRISRIIDELLEISRFQLGHMELSRVIVHMHELVPEAIARFEQTSETHRVVLKRCDRATTRGDRERLEAVLLNLLDNAVRYSSADTEVEVELSVEGHEAIVTVTDRGIGIPRERQPHISELFYRAHAGTPWDYGGMGVGLYISRETIGMHSGRIWFESAEGAGSSFHFSVPLEDRDG